MIINILYNILGFAMLIWYSCIRWTLLGNVLGKVTDAGFKLNWWFAPINMLTAFSSVVFIIPTLFFFNDIIQKPSVLFALVCLSYFLIYRNIWYTVEDIMDYRKNPSTMQLFYIVIDIAMWLYCSLFMFRVKGII